MDDQDKATLEALVKKYVDAFESDGVKGNSESAFAYSIALHRNGMLKRYGAETIIKESQRIFKAQRILDGTQSH